MRTITVVFIILFTSLFIPHESYVLEYIWAWILFGAAITTHHSAQENSGPRIMHLLWAATLIALGITGLMGRSFGASIFTIIRYTEALIIFTLFWRMRPRVPPAQFLHVCYRFIQGAVLSFLLVIALKPFISLLPQYNGLTAINGHHPIAYLLVFFVPVLLEEHYRHPTGSSRLFILLSVVSLAFSASRGATLLIALWLITTLGSKTRGFQRQFMLLSAAFGSIAVFSFIFWLSLLPYPQKVSLMDQFPTISLFIKETPKADPRLEFIRQAIAGLQSAPFFGNGPGTFLFVSRAFERRPALYSSYAHSLPVQTLAAQGIIGSIPFFMLITYIMIITVRLLKHGKDGHIRTLCWSLLLTGAYSIFEGNVNGVPMWLIWWAVAGYVTRTSGATRTYSVVLMRVARYTLLLFVISATLSAALSKSGLVSAAFLAAPYRKDIATDLITSGPKKDTTNLTGLILFFHRLDPDIHAALTNIAPDPIIHYRTAIRLDPYNYSFWQQALTYYWHEKNTGILADFLCSLIKQTHPQTDCRFLTTESFTAFLSGPEFGETLRYLQGTDGLAKFYYFLGLKQATRDTDDTVTFWTLARDIAPNWGYYHLELASAYYYRKNDVKTAQQTLDICTRDPFARQGCNKIAMYPEQLEIPGFFASDIAAIPAIQ